MFPQQSNNTIVGGLDVRLRGGNGRIPTESLLGVPRQDFLSCGFPESQLLCQASVQEPGAHQLGGSEKGRGFTNVKFAHQRRPSFQQEPQGTHWKLIKQQQHVSQDLDRSKQHNMEQSVRAEFPETSYSALLHGPDTPPFHPEPAWDSLAEGEHYSAAEYVSGASKGAAVKSSASLDGCEGARSTFRTQHFWPKQTGTEQKLSTNGPSNLGDADAKEQALVNPNVGLHVQDPVRQSVDASLSSNAQSFMQSQRCAMSLNLETKDVNCSQPQSQEGITEEVVSKQRGLALPPRGIPLGHMPNGFAPQQYSEWNVMQNQNMNGVDGSHMQHAFHTGYNRWDTSAWQEGLPVMEHTPYLPYGSGHMQMGANHGPYNWQTHSTGTMPHAYSHYYPEGYYLYGSNFSNVGETDSAAPPSCETYGYHYPEPQVYLPPANQRLPGFRTPVIGVEGTSNPNRSFGLQDHASQKNHGMLVNAGGQVQPPTPQCTGVKGPHFDQSANMLKKFRKENIVTNGNAEKQTPFHEKDVELEGPQVKKLRESSDVDVYHFKSCQSSGKFSSQTRAGSPNVPDLLGVNGTSSSSRDSPDLQGSTNHSCEKDRRSQALFQGSSFDIGTDEQGPSEIVTRTLRRSGMPSHLRSKEAMKAETSASLMPGNTCRNHTGSTSSVYPFENGAGPPQSDCIPGVRFLSGAQQMQEHEINNGLVPGGSHIGEFSSTRVNTSVSPAQGQSSTDLLMRQLGGRAQIASPPGAPIPLKTSTSQHLQMPAGALKSVLSGKRVSSDAATQELPESQSAMLNPSNIGECPGPLNTSSISYQGTNSAQYAYSTSGYSYSSVGDKAEYPISNLHPEVEQQRTLYSVTNSYQTHLRPPVQTPELRQFEHCKAGPLETGAQLRGFSRPALGKFYPPPPFHSHPWHCQRETGRVANVPLEAETLSEVRASENFEAAMLSSQIKQFASKPENHQANAGNMVEGAFLYPAPGGSGARSRGSVLSESTHVHQLPAFSMEAGSVSMQQPDSTFLYAQATHKFPTKSIDSRTNSSSIMIRSRSAAGPTPMLRDNDSSKALQPSAYPDPSATVRSLRQANEDQHPPPGHYNEIHPEGRESSAFIDGGAAISGKTLSVEISQQASKTNLRTPFSMQQKKRRKSVPSLIPWHIVAAQPRGQLPSMSKAELIWATATNRLPDKDGGGVMNLGILRAESRLKLTTQLMQQIFSPLPGALMHGKQPDNLECGVYNLSKSALGEACRLMTGIEREIESAQKTTDTRTIASNGQTRMWNMAKEIAMTRLVERFMERIKRLDFELARLDCSMSVLELRGKSHDLERVSIVHRLGKHHGPDFSISLSEKRLADAISNRGPLIRKTPPQKYVIAVPMPRTLPEGSRCLSL